MHIWTIRQKCQGNSTGEKKVFSTMDLEHLAARGGKRHLDPYLTSHTKNNLRWIPESNVKSKTV